MAGEEFSEVDLFGERVVRRAEKVGRPETVWNRQTSDRVLLAFARGLTVKDTARLVDLSQPTLRKVYFSECAKRAQARLKLEMLQLARLNDAAAEGNVSAERELARRIDQLRMRDAATAQASDAPTRREPKLGKKAEAELRALEQRGLYEPPPAPSMMN